jgi:hypothetical protein
LTIRAPWSTAYTIAAASSTSVNEPSLVPAFTISSFASPPKPEMPSPFVTEPAASAATKVPWPFVSRMLAVPVRTLKAPGVFAARSGAARSAPVSTTAIVIPAAARSTQSGTPLTCAASNCHSSGDAPEAGTSAGSAAVERDVSRWTKRIPGPPRTRPRTSATWRPGRTRATSSPRSAAAVR